MKETLYFIIPNLLEKLKNIENIKIVEKHENILVSRYLSSLLYFIAIANFFVLHVYFSENIILSLTHSTIYIILGILFHIVTKLNINQSKLNQFIAILTFISLIYLMISYYKILGTAMWFIPAIPLILAVVRVSKEMLISVILAIFITNIYFSYNSNMTNLFNMIANWIIFLVIVAIALVANKVSASRYKMVVEQLNIAQKRKEELAYLATHDSLTDLPNRKYFNDFIENNIKICSKKGKHLVVLFLDIDNFKLINDSMGHIVGDKVLVKVAERLQSTITSTDLLARFGGDEFTFAITNIENVASINSIAENLLKCFDDPYLLQNKEYYISSSIGVAIYPIDGVDSLTLMKNADTALYEAKARGKNNFVLATEVVQEKIDEKMMLTNSLYKALENNEFELYYQPQVCAETTKITGVEALIRWNHPTLGLILPKKFIPLAEQSGQIVLIGKWVIDTACKQIKDWNKKYGTDLKIAVNISVRQLYNEDIVKHIRNTLLETGLEPKNLELEITESMALVAQKDIMHIINALNNLGISIVIDDFGVEYSSLDYLKKVTAKKLKIDMSFIHGIENKVDEAIIKSIIVLAKNMDLVVLAEGVEKESQLEFLKKAMCDEIQGFYFFNPMPVSVLEKDIFT